jgi:hypothetical protein
MKKIPCEFCGKPITRGGAMDAHLHFRHLAEVLDKFRNNPAVIHFLAADRIARGMLLPERCS